MRIAELLFGCPLLFMAIWGIATGDIFVLSDRSSGDAGGWASFDDSPLIFLIALALYGFGGIGLVRAGLKGDQAD